MASKFLKNLLFSCSSLLPRTLLSAEMIPRSIRFPALVKSDYSIALLP